MESEDIVTFCHKDLSNSSYNVFREMRKKNELCDLTMKVRDHSFAAHKVILAGSIPYFRKAFRDGSTEKEAKEIDLANLDPVALESLINFAYSGKVAISAQNVRALLLTSHFLRIKQVREACIQFLAKRIDASNVIDVHELSETLDISMLYELSSRYIGKNFEEFSKSESFLNTPYPWIREIISRDELDVSSEETVVEAILKWVKVSLPERGPIMHKLIREVRVSFLPTEYWMKLSASEELIHNSVHCRDFIDRVKKYHMAKDKSDFEKLKTDPRRCSTVRYDLYAVCRRDGGLISVKKCDVVQEKWLDISESRISSDALSHVFSVNEKIFVLLPKTIHVFDMKKKKWEKLELMHAKTEGSAIAIYKNKMYLFGAVSPSYRQKVRCFDTGNKKWLKDTLMKVGRDYAAATTLDDSIYVTGGYNAAHKRINCVDKYSPSSGHWSECASMLSPKTSHGCVSLNGKIYVCGGFTINGLSRESEVYDPIINRWNLIATMRFSRSNFSFVPYNGKLFAIGGKMGAFAFPADCETYDPECDLWKSAFAMPSGFQSAVSICTARQASLATCAIND